MLKNPALNGNRSPEALVEHMESDPLVRWGWNPDQGLEAVPFPHKEFVNLMTVWVAGGTACPTHGAICQPACACRQQAA